MNNKNQNSTKSVENSSFHRENLQVTENGATFASSQNPLAFKKAGASTEMIVTALGMTPEEVEAKIDELNKTIAVLNDRQNMPFQNFA